MKKISLIVVSIGFGIVIIGLSLRQTVALSFGASLEASDSAQQDASQAALAVPAVADVREASMEVDYYLPYPGILPDHPLYFVKMIRDRVRLWVTRGSTQKYDLLLLYADKRIGAAKVLAAGNQPELAVTTLTKAEKYLGEARFRLWVMADSEGKDVSAQLINLRKAYMMHLSVAQSVKDLVPPVADVVVDQATEVTQRGLKQIEERMGGKLEQVKVERLQRLEATPPAELRK